MKTNRLLLIFAFFFPFFVVAQAPKKPNVIILYADDLGYGDISYNGATQIATPNIDAIAQKGLNFTNAHCTASTCTPSRFSILTGKYAWRKRNTDVLPGDANLTIDTTSTTLPKVFQQAGYATAVIGKWHLGVGNASPINWNQPIYPSPNSIGFDYSFVFPATADRVPNVFLENHQVLGLEANDPITVDYQKPISGDLTGKEFPQMLKMPNDPNQGHNGHISNGIGRIGFMTGGKRSEWTDEELGFTFNQKVMQFIQQSQAQQKPFFLYYAIHDIHVPRMPATEFKGKSKLGYRGDAILELDHTVGVVMQYLKEKNLLQNTIVILSSDNGPVLNDGYLDQSEESAEALQHHAGGIYRGGKYSAFEAGTRVPFMVYWQGKTPRGKSSSALVSQVDLLTSFASFLKVNLSKNEFSDSRNYWKTFIGNQYINRDFIIEQPADKRALAIVSDGWKYIKPTSNTPFMNDVKIETGYSTTDQLYHLTQDPSEKNNVATQFPDKVKALKALLQQQEQIAF